MLHRPLRRPLAAVLVLSLVDYALWNWSVGASHDVVAIVAGLTLIPLLIALTWLLLLGTTRLLGHVARRAGEGAATRGQSRRTAPRRRSRRAARGALSAEDARGTRRLALARSSARGRKRPRVAPGVAEEAAATAGASSSKLAA